jgi:hypothetical protein
MNHFFLMLAQSKRHLAFIFITLLFSVPNPTRAADEGAKVVVLKPDATGLPQDGAALIKILEPFKKTGGEVLIDGGVWLIHERVRLPSNVTIRGRNQPVLRQPGPRLVAKPAMAGEKILIINADSEYRAGGELAILPPEESAKRIATVRIKSVEGRTLNLVEPLPDMVPVGSRVGYFHNMFSGHLVSNISIENLTIDGGRDKVIPMPGHAMRTAIWITAPYSYANGPTGKPSSHVTVRHCSINNCYGRAVAFYHVVDSAVIGCHIGNLNDEAIDFDHFTRRCRAIGNTVEDVTIGVELNDASDCEVLHNRIRGARVGVRIWWYSRIKPIKLNEGNLIQHNSIRDVSRLAIYIGPKCHRNQVVQNFFSGRINVIEPDNKIADNTHQKKDFR